MKNSWKISARTIELKFSVGETFMKVRCDRNLDGRRVFYTHFDLFSAAEPTNAFE